MSIPTLRPGTHPMKPHWVHYDHAIDNGFLCYVFGVVLCACYVGKR